MIKNRALLIAISLVAAAAICSCPAQAKEKTQAEIVAVMPVDGGGFVVRANAGYAEGIVPGMKPAITKEGVVVGWLDVKTADRHYSSGPFEPGCDDCAPGRGYRVALPEKGAGEQPPEIFPPEEMEGGKLPEINEENSKIIHKAFKDFLEGRSPGANVVSPEKPGRDCPSMSKAWPGPAAASRPDPDSDIETELYPAPGDWIRVSGWSDRPPFCIPVDENSAIQASFWENPLAKNRTLARLEEDISDAHPGKTDALDLTLLPADYIKSVATVRILGEVSSPGAHEFRKIVSLREALAAAGIDETYSGSVLAVALGDEGRQIREIRADMKSAASEKGASSVSIEDGEIIFVPDSPESAKAFLDLVLPYLRDIE